MTVLVTGPESSGKSTLARALAWCLDGVYVAEVAREYLHARNGTYNQADLTAICVAQLVAQDLAVAIGASLVVCDTGPEVIKVWSEAKFGLVDTYIAAAVEHRDYHLTILCSPDLPWQYDALRETPDSTDRQRLFERYRALLPHAMVVAGPGRVAQALAAMTRLTGGEL